MPVRDTSHKGALGEQLFANHFLENRIFISQPIYDLWGADFVVEWEGGLHKVNVKTMSKQKTRGYFQVNLRHGTNGLSRYEPGQITYFGIVNLFYKRIWMVPLEAARNKGLCYFGPLENRQKNTTSMFRWENYRIK